jgi:hypothetical protein
MKRFFCIFHLWDLDSFRAIHTRWPQFRAHCSSCRLRISVYCRILQLHVILEQILLHAVFILVMSVSFELCQTRSPLLVTWGNLPCCQSHQRKSCAIGMHGRETCEANFTPLLTYLLTS